MKTEKHNARPKKRGGADTDFPYIRPAKLHLKTRKEELMRRTSRGTLHT